MTAIGFPTWVFGFCLLAVFAVSYMGGGRFMPRVSGVLFANWAAHMIHFAMTGDPSPYQFSIFADLLSAWAILIRPAGRMQSYIGMSLLVQIGISAGYWMHVLSVPGDMVAAGRYWAWLDWIALIQIALVMGWFGDGATRVYLGLSRGSPVPWHRARAAEADRGGVADA